MLNILNVSPEARLEVNALFLQPSFWCARNCPGCYVKAHYNGGPQSYHLPYQEQIQIFTLFYEGIVAWANQITIAIDNLPAYENNPLVRRSSRNNLISMFEEVLLALSTDSLIEHPEVHLTFRSLDTLLDYMNISHGRWSELKNINMITLSNITEKDIVSLGKQKSLLGYVPLNYNHMCQPNVTSTNVNKYVKHLIKVGEVVDSIYMVLFKKPLGMPSNSEEDEANLSGSLRYIQTMKERLPQHISDKIHIDGCIEDAQNFLQTGFGCSSNCSRFQVWPDGSVSGCAYAWKSNTPEAKTAEDVLTNIRLARGFYDFEQCNLPRLLDHIQRRPTGIYR